MTQQWGTEPRWQPGDGHPEPSQATPSGPEPSDQGVQMPAEAEKTPRRKGWRRFVAISVVAAVVALFSGGAVVGWYVRDLALASQTSEEPKIIEIPASEAVAEQPMLDLRGMNLIDAKQALVDTGIPVTGLKVVEVPWAGLPGVVIAQEPVVGEAVASDVQLQVSIAAAMPKVLGAQRVDAVNELKRLGVEVEIVEEYALDRPTGSVLSSVPVAGEPLPAVVQLAVAQAGAAVYLSQLNAADGRCSKTEANIDGEHHANSLGCRGGDPKPNVTVYLLNRLTRQVEGVVGVADEGAMDQAAEVVFLGDGKPLATASVSYAKPAKVSFDTTGVLRLEIHVTSPTHSTAMLGDFLVKGSVEEMARLGTGS